MLYFVILSFVIFALARAGCNGEWEWTNPSYMDKFISRIDPEFDPNVDEIIYYNNTILGCHSYVLNFTSGRWMTGNYSSQPIWWHYLTINIPLEDNINFFDAGFLFIDGGSNGGPPDQDDEFIISMCALTRETGTISAVLKQVPNQDIIFADDPLQNERGEDDLIAWTWRDFILLHDDPDDYIEADYERIAQFPMTRAGVRACDVMNVFSKKKVPGSDLSRFGVSGGSKRGWISWLVAATDPRIEYTAPLVISVLNTATTFHHHYENLGGWTWAFGDYWIKNITYHLDDPRTQMLFDEIDPICYNPRLTMHKMVGCATNDEFFAPDASYDFFSTLPEPKYMLMMENAEHSLMGEYRRIGWNLITMWYSQLTGFKFPHMNWTMEEDETGGLIRITTDTIPTSYISWRGDTKAEDNRRDWRGLALDGFQIVRWNDTDEADWTIIDDYNYIVHYNRSTESPYRGFVVDMFFDGPTPDMEFELTTEVAVIPNNRPYPPCVGHECRATIV
ncbi:hypothetical protein LSH36_154g12018 [Paralvinella palmiformis]|uniref:Peptidase S9 prolyl oligopeptidase catalytic domain-containing protein n=1 Tax=Paralvinella palmiformis TaxID=53620 RepID=A0AAD9JV71_9ANNE|nr:hypothetical protein LSH36_154g12018 [Paralvinella palmiformis]